MDKLPNEICVHILMFLSFSELLVLSRVSKKNYFLCNVRVDLKQLADSVWSLYINKTIYFNALDECRLDIFKNLIKSFKMFKLKQYLVACLEKKIIIMF